MNTHTVSAFKPTHQPYFGHQHQEDQPPKKTDDEINAMGCCERRNHGIPVGCCDPQPKDQVVFITLPEGKTVDDYAMNHDEDTPKKNILSRTLSSITHFFKTLFGGFFNDLKSVFKRQAKQDTTATQA